MKRLALLLLTASLAAKAQEPGQHMTITGDQELPSVLYVVPWRTPSLQPVLEPLLDNPVLAPLGPCDTLPGVANPPGCDGPGDTPKAAEPGQR